jgi:hypothetical protein
MIDIELIRQKYAAMSDEELILLASAEDFHFSDEAYPVFKDEFLKRNLDITILENLENKIAIQRNRSAHALQKSIAQEYTQSVWTYAIKAKLKSKTNYEIYNGLLKRGVEPDSAFYITNSLRWKLEQMRDHCYNGIFKGLLTVGIGLLLIVLPSVIDQLYAFAWGFMLLGVVRFFVSLFRWIKVKHAMGDTPDGDDAA